jgi:SAM-dependent methyltransferase
MDEKLRRWVEGYGKKRLNMGCGQRKDPWEFGIDIDSNSKADMLVDLDKFPYPIPDDSFDQVYCSHVIEHLKDWVNAIREMIRITKNGGTIEILTPHCSSVVSFSTVGHINHYAISTFTMSLPNIIKEYEIEKIELRYLLTTERHKSIWEKVFHKMLTYLANRNLHLCERVWCYWFGGFNEIYVKMRVKKKIQNKRRLKVKE